MGIPGAITVRSSVETRIWGNTKVAPTVQLQGESLASELRSWNIPVSRVIKGFRFLATLHTLGPRRNECVDCCAKTREDLQRDCKFPWRFLERSAKVPKPNRLTAIKNQKKRGKGVAQCVTR